ncbi:MAG TPA: PIN domain-containing protein [Desulfobacteraceae bacterium]|nr:PIN domain-containing protein [Desulfobacteraceae bacterium]
MAEKILKVFLDSNVIISGLFSDRGAPRLILDVLSLELPVLKAVTGAYNTAEVERNLEAKLPAALPAFHSFLSYMNLEIVPLPSRNDVKSINGMTAEKDLPVIASAIIGQADVLVTGDKKAFLNIKQRALPFKVLSPAEFLNKFLPDFLKGCKKVR